MTDLETMDDAAVFRIMREAIAKACERGNLAELGPLLLAWEIRAYRVVSEAQANVAMGFAATALEGMKPK